MLLCLLQQKFNVVPGREPYQPNLVRKIFGNFDRARPDGAGAAQENNVLHMMAGLVNTCLKYTYIKGALNSRLSSKSRIPPIPGNRVPESFTPASRLNNDSM